MDQTKPSRGRLVNTSKGFFLLFLGFAPCAPRVPKIINIKTKQSFASIASLYMRTTELKKNKLEKSFND